MSNAEATTAEWLDTLKAAGMEPDEPEAVEPESSESEPVAPEPEQPDTTPEPEPDEPAEASAGPEQPEEDDGTAEPSAHAGSGPADEPETPQLELRPFHFKVDGKQVEEPGIHEAGDFVVIHKDTWNRRLLPNWVADRSVWRSTEREFRRKIEQLEKTRSAKEEHAATIGKLFDEVMALPEEDVWEWVQTTKAKYPVLKAEAEAKYYRDLATHAQTPTPTSVDREELAEQKQTALRTYIRQRLNEQQATALVDPEKVYDRLWHDRRLYLTAPQDTTDLYGQPIRKGDEIIESGFLYGVIDAEIAAARARQKAPAPSAAVARNAAATGKVTGKSAPSAPAATDTAARKPVADRTVKTKDDWNELLAKAARS